MGIGLTEEHRALAASVRGLVERTDDHAALARQGLLGLHLPEEWGGQGYGLLELCVALEALAEHRVTGPYLATVLTSAVLARARGGRGEQYGHPHADDDDPGTRRNQRGGRRGGSDGWRPGGLIPALADGSLTAAVALPADAPAVGTHPAGPLPDGPLPAGPRPVGPMLAGSAPEPAAVPGPWLALGPADAGLFLVPMGGGAWAVLDPEDVAVEPADGIDLDRALCHVTPRGPVPDDRVLAGAPVREIAAVLLGADACGVAAWAVATASAYAQVREQFGRPIGQFQGVKHRVAAALVALEQARAAVWDAARALDAPPAPHPEGPRHTTRASDTEDRRPTPVPDTEAPRHATPAPDTPGASALADDVRLAVGVAGVLGTDAGVRCAGDAIQVLGGIGYTFEHDAHRYYRRALSDRMLAGDPGLWAEEVAELAVAGVRRAMEPDLPEEAAAVRDTVRAAAEALRAEAPAARRTRMAEEGWIMPYLPEPWGRGASPLEQVVIQQEFGGLGRPNLGIGAWAAPSIVRYGTREQQERFVPGTLTGEIVWCQLFSEPGAGSDLAGLSTKATRVEGGWSLTGQKIWTSLAQHAHWGICLARTAPERPKHDGISYFL
ncbi:MAG TPA: acyl-CoA dehydrogenase, partial [Nonomuraea sp.]|nr:acyl-CoA dehydrogenase [Nonomuraea sp.]